MAGKGQFLLSVICVIWGRNNFLCIFVILLLVVNSVTVLWGSEMLGVRGPK